MQPIQITIRDLPASPVLEEHIRKKAKKLTQFYNRINSCRVVITSSQKQHQGNQYSVRIDMTVPGKELVVNHKHDQDVYVAIRDAFKALERQLEEYVQKQRGHVKHHAYEEHGIISKVFAKEGYGFIEDTQGEEHYFSTDNVVSPRFEQLKVGDAVEFIETVTHDGVQASRVIKLKHNGFAGRL